MHNCELSIIIPTYFDRTAKLRRLLEGLGRTRVPHPRFEIIVVVDAPDDRPLAAADVLPDSIRFDGSTHEHSGPGGARNQGLARAAGRWVLFLNDDAVLGDDDVIAGHLQQLGGDPGGRSAYLGDFRFRPDLLNSPWRHLLNDTSMLFFYHHMRPGHHYPYRHFWTCHLSIRRDLLTAVGGFSAGLSDRHEDLEIGWRLERQQGLALRWLPHLRVWHDHAMTPRDYFHLEYRSGRSARQARQVNRPFHDETWGWLADAEDTGRTLGRLWAPAAGRIRRLLELWAKESPRLPTKEEQEAAYLAHLPLKRLAFCRGYVGAPFDPWWEQLLHDR